MPRRWIRVSAAVAALAAVTASLGYRATYGSFAWWEHPTRILWCGRTYLPAHDTVTGAEIESVQAALPGDEPYPVVTVTHVPPFVGRPVLAARTPPATQQRSGVPCAMAVYVRTGPDRYLPYGLSGRP